MKRTVIAVMSLYPKPWRDRYQNEFRALLDDVPPTWKTFFDVFGGAMKMQIKTGSAWKIVAAFALAGLIVAASTAFWIPNQYQSTAVIKLVDTNPDQLSSIAQNIESRAFLVQLIMNEDLYKKERTRAPMEDLVEEMKTKAIMIRPVRSTKDGEVSAFSISFVADDPGQAKRTTERLASAFVAAKAGELIDPASLPSGPFSPRRSRILIFGLIAGTIVGAAFALFSGLRVWKLAAACGIGGMLLSVIPWYFVADRYRSVAVIRCGGSDCQLPIQRVMSQPSLDAIAQNFHLDPTKLKDHLKIRNIVPSRAVMVLFEGTDRYKAQQVTTHVVSRLIDENVRQHDANRATTLELLDPASLPWNPSYPNRAIPAGLGLFIGLTCAVLIGIRRSRQLPPTAT